VKKRIGKDVKGRGSALIWCFIQPFSWNDMKTWQMCKDSRCFGRDSNLVLSEYASQVLAL
jgi:hypothetical protein